MPNNDSALQDNVKCTHGCYNSQVLDEGRRCDSRAIRAPEHVPVPVRARSMPNPRCRAFSQSPSLRYCYDEMTLLSKVAWFAGEPVNCSFRAYNPFLDRIFYPRQLLFDKSGFPDATAYERPLFAQLRVRAVAHPTVILTKFDEL